MQHAVAAALAALLPDTLLGGCPHESSIEGRVDALLRQVLGDGLHADAAAERKHGIVVVKFLRQWLQIFNLALALYHGFINFQGLAIQLGGHA